MTDQPIPGLGPDKGPLNTTHARWLGICRTCRQPILWAVTTTGRRIPVDVHPTERGNLTLVTDGHQLIAGVHVDADGPRYLSHFATCKDANRHRKARR